MTKKTVVTAMVCIAICIYTGYIIGGQTPTYAPRPARATLEPPDVDITIGGGWLYDDMPGSVTFEMDGCVCGEPRDDGRDCDVYVNITGPTQLTIWSNMSPEELEGVAGVEWVREDGRRLHRDRRYSWQAVIDNICELADEILAYDDPPLLWMGSTITPVEGAVCQGVDGSLTIFGCCANFADGRDCDDVVGYSEFCPHWEQP